LGASYVAKALSIIIISIAAYSLSFKCHNKLAGLYNIFDNI